MFFKRKSKNRRLGRESVLDVRIRSSQARAARTRVLTLLITGGLALALVAVLVWRGGVWALNHFFYENPQFSLQNLEIRNEGVIPADQIRRWTGLQPGDNLLRLDLSRVKRDLELVSFIQSISVERILPHTLRIQVTERTPIAQLHLRQTAAPVESVFYLDPEGMVIVPLDPRERIVSTASTNESLPLLSGIRALEVRAGRRVDDPQVHAALQLVTAFERSSISEVAEIKSIDVSAPEVLILTTTQSAQITFALSDLDQQLRRWREIHNEGQKFGREVSTLDLAVSNNIPARWIEAGTVPAIPVKPLKTARPIKKHV
jgi:cell division protein FtsQ